MLRFLQTFNNTQYHNEWNYYSEFHTNRTVNVEKLETEAEYTDDRSTGLFEMIVGVLTTCHLFLHMQSHVISLYEVTSRIIFMFLLSPQVSRN